MTSGDHSIVVACHGFSIVRRGRRRARMMFRKKGIWAQARKIAETVMWRCSGRVELRRVVPGPAMEVS